MSALRKRGPRFAWVFKTKGRYQYNKERARERAYIRKWWAQVKDTSAPRLDGKIPLRMLGDGRVVPIIGGPR